MEAGGVIEGAELDDGDQWKFVATNPDSADFTTLDKDSRGSNGQIVVEF